MSDGTVDKTETSCPSTTKVGSAKLKLIKSNSDWRGLYGTTKLDDSVEMDYGAITKEADYEITKFNQKTGFSFLGGNGRESVLSQLSVSSNVGSSAPIHAFFNLCKVFVGIGILTGPAAMSHWGIVLGVLGVTFAGLMSLYSINIQAQTRHKLQSMAAVPNDESGGEADLTNEREEASYRRHEIENSIISEAEPIIIYINNYSDLGRAAFGQAGYIFVSMCLFLQQMWSVTAYFSFIHNYIPIGLAVWIIVPFWLFWNIKKISYLSLFSLIAIILALMLVLYHSVEHITEVPKTDLKYFDILKFPYFFGVSIFIFEGNCASLQIETSMKEPKKFKWVSVFGICFVIFLNCLLSCLAYISYVGTIKDVVLFNLPATFLSRLVRISYSFGLMFSIPIQIAPMVDTMYRTDAFDPYVKLFREKPRTKYYASVLIIIFTCVMAALLIPGLQMFINLSGSLVGILTLSIIPTLFYNKAFKEEITTQRLVLHYVMMIVMSMAGGVSIFYSLNHMMSA